MGLFANNFGSVRSITAVLGKMPDTNDRVVIPVDHVRATCIVSMQFVALVAPPCCGEEDVKLLSWTAQRGRAPRRSDERDSKKGTMVPVEESADRERLYSCPGVSSVLPPALSKGNSDARSRLAELQALAALSSADLGRAAQLCLGW